jgi:hypothetical protein
MVPLLGFRCQNGREKGRSSPFLLPYRHSPVKEKVLRGHTCHLMRLLPIAAGPETEIKAGTSHPGEVLSRHSIKAWQMHHSDLGSPRTLIKFDFSWYNQQPLMTCETADESARGCFTGPYSSRFDTFACTVTSILVAWRAGRRA